MVNKPFHSYLGRVLRRKRKDLGLIQSEVCGIARISLPTLRNLERGRGRTASWFRAVSALGCQLRGRNLPFEMSLGQGLVTLRKRRGIGQRELARLSQVSRPSIIALEHDQSASLSALDRILAVLGAGPRLERVGEEASFYSTVSTSSAFHGWETPEWLLERLHSVFGRFDLDPCSPSKDRRRCRVRARVRFTVEDDALSLAWFGNVFVNPPYGRELGAWTAKARAEFESGSVDTLVALVPARTDTNWWHRDIIPFGTVFFLRGRLRFGDGQQSAPFPSALVVFGGNSEQIQSLSAVLPDSHLVFPALNNLGNAATRPNPQK